MLRVYLTDRELAALRHRAAAHRESASAFARRAALAPQVDGRIDADALWSSLSPARKESIARWLLGLAPPPLEVVGQLALDERD